MFGRVLVERVLVERVCGHSDEGRAWQAAPLRSVINIKMINSNFAPSVTTDRCWGV